MLKYIYVITNNPLSLETHFLHISASFMSFILVHCLVLLTEKDYLITQFLMFIFVYCVE